MPPSQPTASIVVFITPERCPDGNGATGEVELTPGMSNTQFSNTQHYHLTSISSTKKVLLASEYRPPVSYKFTNVGRFFTPINSQKLIALSPAFYNLQFSSDSLFCTFPRQVKEGRQVDGLIGFPYTLCCQLKNIYVYYCAIW